MNRRIKKKYMKRAILARIRLLEYCEDNVPLIGVVKLNAWTHHIGREDKDVADAIAASTFLVSGRPAIRLWVTNTAEIFRKICSGSKKFVTANKFGQRIVLPSIVRVDIDDGYRNETIIKSSVEGPHFYDEEKTMWESLFRGSDRLEKI